MILWSLLFVLIVWMGVYRYKRRRLYELAARLPGTKRAYPILGMIPVVIGSPEVVMGTMQELSYEAMAHNGILKGWLNHLLYFLVVNPYDLGMILKMCLEKDDLHRFMQKGIGSGSIFAPVSIWRPRRKILIPAFSPKIFENFVEVFNQQSEILADRLSAKTSKNSFSIWHFISAYTLDSIFETSMGVKLNAQKNPTTSVFLTSMTTVLNIMCERMRHLWLHPDWLFRFFPQYAVHEKCIKFIQDFTDEVIQKKRMELKKDALIKPEVDHHFNLQDYQKNSFLDLLINLSGGEKGYTNVELREEILTLIVAGTDTSATSIGFTLLLLGKYPKIQDKVYEELYEVFGDSERSLVKDDLQNLKYLERVVKESLRLFPPVPFIVRKIENEIKLPTGRSLPMGSGVMASIWGCHRNPEFWGEDAECFDPDRFLPERFTSAQEESYLPFSNGPRNCIGYRYGLMSVMTALSAILRKYIVLGEPEATPIPHIRVKIDIMLKAVDHYQVSLENRKSSTTK